MLDGSCVPEEACTQCVGEDGVRHQVGAWNLHFSGLALSHPTSGLTLKES